MDEWQFKLEAQRLLASAVGANDDHRQDPAAELEWQAEREAVLEERRRFNRQTIFLLLGIIGIGYPAAYLIDKYYHYPIMALLNPASLNRQTSMCTNQAEVLANVPVGDFQMIAIIRANDDIDCHWMNDQQFAEMKAKPGFRLLSPP